MTAVVRQDAEASNVRRSAERTEVAPSADVVSIRISDLVTTEEHLAHQAHLGDLHPVHARRLAAVTAELDRRWASHA